MNRFLALLLFLISFALPVLSEPIIPDFEQTQEETKPIEAQITFDWISKTQMQRDENIEQIKNILFTPETPTTFSKSAFREKYKNFLKNKNYLQTYEDLSKGKKEDGNAYYCVFKLGNSSLIIMYAIQYKKDPHHIFYYDAMGGLRFIDISSGKAPNYPYSTYQYTINGKLVAAYYYNSQYDQYAYDENGKFKGRWYKDKFYNRRAKVIMTRSSW